MTAVESTKAELVESFDMTRSLIQEAKPREGYITDHLDAAENWLDKAEAQALTAWNNRPATVAKSVADGLAEALSAIAESGNQSANGFRIWAKRRANHALTSYRKATQ